MQACYSGSIRGVLSLTPNIAHIVILTVNCEYNSYLTPNIAVFRSTSFDVESELRTLIRCAPLLCRVEVQTLAYDLWKSLAHQTLQTLRSLPQSITWGPLELRLYEPLTQSTSQEVCAALGGTALAQAVSKLTLIHWGIEAPIAALHASFPIVLHFELDSCPPSMASSLSEAIAVWPFSLSHSNSFTNIFEGEKQHLEAAARIAAELKAGEPFEIVLIVDQVNDGDEVYVGDAGGLEA